MQESTDKSSDALILEALAKAQTRQDEFNRTVIAELSEIKKSIATIMSCIVTDYEKIIHSAKPQTESLTQKLESLPAEVVQDLDKLVVVEKKMLGGWIGDIIVKTWTKVPNTIIGIGHSIIWMLCSRKKD